MSCRTNRPRPAPNAPRSVSSRRRPDVWNQRRTVVYGIAHEERMGIGKVLIDANHAVVLAGSAFVRGDQFTGSIPIVRAV